MIILSILIPTIPERGKQFKNLLKELHAQVTIMEALHGSLGEVQIISDPSPKFLNGGPSIGKKRETLVKKAEGRYLCFLDDDEEIAGNYLETLVRLCHNKADVVTFRSLANLENFWCLIDMSLYFEGNEQAGPETIVKRKPWHICPVKSHLAKVHNFEDKSYGEDWNWFEKVLKTCSSEAKTDAIIHMYKHRTSESEADEISRAEKIKNKNNTPDV